MMLYRSSGELVLEDSPDCFDPSAKSGAVVVVDIATGRELGRAPINETGTMGMFLCPVTEISNALEYLYLLLVRCRAISSVCVTQGFQRDFYVASIAGTITRVFVNSEKQEGKKAAAKQKVTAMSKL